MSQSSMETSEGLGTRSSSIRARRRVWFSEFSPLARLLSYVPPHRKYALLTVFFGTTGFLLSFAYPWIIGSVIDLITGKAWSDATPDERWHRLLWLTELATATAVLHAAVVYGRGHYSTSLGDAIVTDLRKQLFSHLQKLSVGFYTRERTGAILSRVLHDVHDATAVLYMGLIVVFLDAAQLLIAFVLLSGISLKLTAACGLIFPTYGLVFAAMNPRVRNASARVQEQLCRISGNVAEQLSGQALVKTYTAEDREARQFEEDASEHHARVVEQSHAGHLVSSYGEVLVHIGTTIVIGYGGALALRGELTPGMLTRFLGYTVILYGPVRRLAELNITYQSSLSALRRIFRLLEIRPSITEPANPVRTTPKRGEVCFEHVRFRYGLASDEASVRLEDDGRTGEEESADQSWVLDGVSLSAKPGERVAIVGASGAGKSTLISLLPRLYDVTHGRVLVDGIDVRDYSLHALRSSIAIVQQDSFVFTGSIRDNICYGRPDASDAEMVAAAQAAHAHEFILRCQGGYGAKLGERGVNLSGGQRQRLSIARALLKDPRILILDEATSALDAESESIVQAALARLMEGRTCFIIAHRLSTIRNADRILVLVGGRIGESGTHQQLLAANGTYARFIRNQAVLM